MLIDIDDGPSEFGYPSSPTSYPGTAHRRREPPAVAALRTAEENPIHLERRFLPVRLANSAQPVSLHCFSIGPARIEQVYARAFVDS
jgi:hypothetical protein